MIREALFYLALTILLAPWFVIAIGVATRGGW